MQPQHSIEISTAREVQDGVGVLLNGIVFDVDSVMSGPVEATHSHIGHRTSFLRRLRMSEVVSEETHRLQFSHHIIEQVLLKNAVLSRYDHVHIAALLFSPAVGTAHLNVVPVDGRDHSLNDVLHEVEHARHFLPRDFLLELFEVFEADLLVSVEQVRSFAHVFDALDSHAVKLVCFGRTNAPNFAHVAPRHVLFFALQGLQLVYFSSLQQFLDFICDFVSDSSQILHVFFGLYLSIESPDDGCSLHVRHPPSFIALSSINFHQFRKLVRDVCIH
jgi:hypothetical protein